MRPDGVAGSPSEPVQRPSLRPSLRQALKLALSLSEPTTQELSEQVELVCRNFSFALLCACGGAGVLTLALQISGAATGLVWTWLAIYTAYSTLAVWRVRVMPKDWPATRQAQRLVLWMVGLSITWSAILAVTMWSGQDDALLGTALILTSVLAGSLAFTAPHVPVYLAFNVPVLGLSWAMAAGLCLTRETPGSTLMGIAWGVPVYLLANWYFAVNASRTTLTSIRLRFTNQALIHDLETQRAVAEQARRDAEDANRAKSVFLAAASHDLRQPIHALGLFLGALERRTLDPRQTTTLAGADRSLKASREMLDALLDFSRIEAGVVHAKAEPFALQPLLLRLVSEFGQQAD